jgi:DNA (cytosine-5)-methyltransferase 1
MMVGEPIPVIDIFAGPGGLSEGFSSVYGRNGESTFEICLSIENDAASHRTLELRSFFQQFRGREVPRAYYDYITGKSGRDLVTREKLFAQYPKEAARAKRQAWQATLGKIPISELKTRIVDALGERTPANWVLIGGPPCQAYSLAGRSRMKREKGEEFLTDHRHVLYKEYLRILANHEPTVFIMENVKGLLSSKHEDHLIVERIIHDLQHPGNGASYRLFSLVSPEPRSDELAFPSNGNVPHAKDFVIAAEQFGIPQARHRVIFLGVSERYLASLGDIALPTLKPNSKRVSVTDVIDGLPRLRSGVSKAVDGSDSWKKVLQGAVDTAWFRWLRSGGDTRVAQKIQVILQQLRAPRADRGDLFVETKFRAPRRYRKWYCDSRISGVCNHESRRHIEQDLHRYLFASCYAAVHGVSPKLRDFPPTLLPRHKNVNKALTNGLFNDRFRVQRSSEPATTVTSHIAKDGHYFIHPDPRQCRSLTVREAARLQTFPDNYYFEGTRTDQYRQVGNAVPPLLAKQIAVIVRDILFLK